MSGAADIRHAVPAESAEPHAFAAQLESWRVRMERALSARLPGSDAVPARLHEAMRYSVLGGGKRVRPILLFATARTLGLAEGDVEAAACALELVHVYSLVHDDLPAMDDDDLRRGRPTCHRAFDEGTAILVGDALQALGFAVLSSEPMAGTAPAARLEMLRVLAGAIGTRGMAGGQAVDLAAVGKRLSVSAVEDMHRRKTGALIECSVLLGALAAGVSGAAELGALRRFGAEIGLAFQIQDDILDVEGDPALLGKSIGADAAHAKPTYPSTAGLAASRLRAAELRDAAIASLAPFGERGAALAQLAGLMVSRVS